MPFLIAINIIGAILCFATERPRAGTSALVAAALFISIAIALN